MAKDDYNAKGDVIMSDKLIEDYINKYPILSKGIYLTIDAMRGMGYSDRHIEHIYGIDSPSKLYIDGEDGTIE